MRVATLACLIALSGCGALQKPAPAVAVHDVQTALASYQAALGVAQVALRGDPTLLAKVNALSAQAAPYVGMVQTGANDATIAPSLAALAAEMLVTAAPAITVVANHS